MSTEAKIPEADLKNVNLKPTETVEKVILPSAEDVNRERVPLDAASFQKENLKKVTPIVNDQVQRESSILKAAKFDHQNLKKVETEEKTRLPSTEGKSDNFITVQVELSILSMGPKRIGCCPWIPDFRRSDVDNPHIKMSV